MRRHTQAIGLASLALLALACAEAPPAAPEWCSSSSEAVEVRISTGPVPELRLDEVWRVGGLNDEQVIAGANRPSVSRGGRVAIPDMTAAAVLVVEPDGTWLGAVTRAGDGPGEIRWPVDVEWLDETHLAVFDLAKGAIQLLPVGVEGVADGWLIDGELYRRMSASGFLPGVDLAADGSLLIELPWQALQNNPFERRAVVVRLFPDGNLDTIQTQRVTVLGKAPFAGWATPGTPRPIIAAGASGSVFLAGTDSHYRVRLLSSSGTDSILICRDVLPLPYTDAEQGKGLLPEERELARVLEEARRPESPTPLGAMFSGEGGSLWVLRDRPNPMMPVGPVEAGIYDVFDGNGQLRGEVRAPDRVVLFGEGGGQVYGLERGEFDELSIVAYRLR